MTRRQLSWSAALVCLMTMAAATTQAQIRVASSVIGSGGGAATSGGTIMSGTIGQAVIGPTTSPSMGALQGFWYTIIPPTPTSVPGGGADLLAEGAYLRSWPNPITTEGELHVRIDAPGPISVKLYDALGREVRTLAEGQWEAGTFTVYLDAKGLESGSYVAQLVAGGARHAIKMVVVK